LHSGKLRQSSVIMRNHRFRLTPSLICMDLCNLESEVRQMEELGVDMLHIDLLDGYFSPSMPIGLDVIRQLRRITDLPFDAHVMVREYGFFLEELLNIGMQRVAIHGETCTNPDRLLSQIRSAGAQAGLAISPGTSLHTLDYLKHRCDFVLHMMINPGYASVAGENLVPYALEKLRDLRRLVGPDMDITVDGHVETKMLPVLIAAGATTFVTGTKSLFCKQDTRASNNQAIRTIFEEVENSEFN